MKFMFRIPNNVEVRKEGCPHSRGVCSRSEAGGGRGGPRGGGSQNSSTFRCWLSPRQLPPARAGLLQGTKCNFIRMVVGSLSKSFRQALTGGALRPTVLVQKRLCHEGPTQDLAVPPHLSAMAPPCRTHPLPARSLLPISHSSPVAHRRIFLWTFQTRVSSPTSLPSPSASSRKTLPVDTWPRPDSTTWSVSH